MRLTLRTLLAYLDNTVEPEDAELLRNKLQQSGFATQLVQRIRASVKVRTYSAPAPQSVHPIEEPNMISEYLDSTLSPEQIAEVEKACLESEPHLAEAAACHQILTMILGKPADVSDELRDRMYAMVDTDGNPTGADPLSRRDSAAIAGEIGPRHGIDLGQAAVTISGPTDFAALADQPPPPFDEPVGAAGAVSVTSQPISGDAPKTVPPVGVDDSGVFEAATKLKEQAFATPDAGATLDETERMAGSRPLKQLERSDLYEGDVRPSRVTPYLVTLALVGALLFAIVQIFQPFVGPKKVAQEDEVKMSEQFPAVDETDEVVVPAELSPPMESVGEGAVEINADAQGEETDELPAGPVVSDPAGENNVATATDEGSVADADVAAPTGGGDSAAEVAVMPAPVADPDAEASDPPGIEVEVMPAPGTPADLPAPTGSEVATTEATDPDARVAMVEKSGDAEVAPPGESVKPGDLPPAEPNADDPNADDPNAEAPADVPAEVVGVLISDKVLVGRHDTESDKWGLVPAGAELASGQRLVCGPEYRAQFQTVGRDAPNVTLVGPTGLSLQKTSQDVGVDVEFGRGIIVAASIGESIAISAVGQTIVLTAETPDSAIGFDLTHRLDFGADPMIGENHTATLRLVCTAGTLSLAVGGLTATLSENQAVVVSDATTLDALNVVDLETAPPWVDSEIDTGSLELEAASNLWELVQPGGNDLMLALRVALGFRRNEVAALAGKTKLALGDASAYFGVDGLFNQPKQRLYWSGHLDAIRALMSRSVEDAAAVRSGIAGEGPIDDADGDVLFRLLMGYSQEQLETGGDVELVSGLESASMPVRVLASENLRDISGTTLFFKPEETIASRREEVVKKWKARLRKESIRWPKQDAE